LVSRQRPRSVWRSIRPSLPAGPTPGERPQDLQPWRGLTPPPLGSVSTPAEYQFNDGMVVRWGSFNALLTQMTVAVTNGDPDAIVYVVVTGGSQQSSATSILQGAGADMSQVQFITQPCSPSSSCSVWMRDYGPRYVVVNGQRAIMDHTYNRPSRTTDNAFPALMAQLTGQTLYDIGITHGGGNFHLFADRRAFMTDLIVAENPGQSAATIRQRYQDYQGLDLTIVDAFPQSFDSTQHIDMWMLPLATRKVLLSEYPASTGNPATGEPRRITEELATQFAGEGYEVFRTPGWGSGSGVHYTYANAVLMNQVALVCQFNGFPTQNAQALATFAQALPDRTVVGVDCTSIINSAGSIHCIVMHVSGALPEITDALLRNGFED
jgi:agmatine/peptidylarginine deiminase